MMQWKMEHGGYAPQEAVRWALRAQMELEVPAGLVLATCECESDFRLGLVSGSGAVGPMQIRRKYEKDYFRYAGFAFDLEGWEAVYGAAAVLAKYAQWAKARGVAGHDAWRWAACCYRWGQNAPQMESFATCKRVKDVERHMERNDCWYEGWEVRPPAGSVSTAASDWALTKLGSRYSRSERAEEEAFDCSSLVARAYAAQGVEWACMQRQLPLSCELVYSDRFRMLWPSAYNKIGKTFAGKDVLFKACEPGDLQFLCTDKKTHRSNRITHVAMVADCDRIVHARGEKYGVRTDDILLYAGKVCAVLRYDPDAPLVRGMRGNRVLALQKKLNACGAALETDGIYGAKTDEAVKKFGKEGEIC